MPPNIKFPVALSMDNELINVGPSVSSNNNNNDNNDNSPHPPLTLDGADDDDAFFLHDIEENIPAEAHWDDEHKKVHDQPPPEQQETQKDTEVQHHDDHHAHRVIRHLASQIDDPDQLNIDDMRLARAVRDAGEFSYGVIACEVWILDEDDKLVRPKGGWWHNSKLYQNSLALEDLALETPKPVSPGVDLPGILWTETAREGHGLLPSVSSTLFHHTPHGSHEKLEIHLAQQHHHHHSQNPANTHSSPRASTGTGLFRGSMPSMEGLVHLNPLVTNPHALVWRDLHSIKEDPDSAKTKRLGQLLKAGLCAAAGVPFHVREHRGLVIYFARSHTRTHLLSNVANDAFLRASAEMIGHAASLSETRRASVEARRRQRHDAAGRFQRNVLAFRKNHRHDKDIHLIERTAGALSQSDNSWNPDSSGPEEEVPTHARFASAKPSVLEEDLPPEETSSIERMYQGMRSWLHKCRGGDLQVPPSLSYRQALWTIFGAFCGLLVLSSLNEYYKILSNDDYYLLIGPFGALMTLQYGLTAAPASQPRNAVLGQAVSGAVSLAFTYIPESILPVWLRRAVGPAFGIGAMVKLGVTHPPAGAHAVLYASGQYNFAFYALVVMSSAISVIPATIVNNMSSKRQYPTYWTLIPLLKPGRSKAVGKKADK